MGRLTVNLAGVTFKNPVMPASGTAAYGQQMAQQLDLSALGGLVINRRTESGQPTTNDRGNNRGVAQCNWTQKSRN